MNPSIHRVILTVAAAVLVGITPLRAETETLHYPTQDNSMFSIEAPSEWKVTAIEEVGDFGTLESENGSVLQFRAIEAENEEEAKNEIDTIFDSTAEFLAKNYTDIELDEPKEINVQGQPGAQLTGSGKDKDGNAVVFLSAMIALGPTTIAEIWAAVAHEDNDDLAQAQKMLESYKPSSN